MTGVTAAGVDTARIEAAVSEILAAIGDDPGRPGLSDTPRRVAEAYTEFFSGLGVDTAELLEGAVVPAEPGQLGQLVIVRDIEFRSVCEHHLLPFLGRAHVAYVPGDRIVGLGRIPALIDALASRPQLQERLGEEIVAALDSAVHPAGVLVVLDAVHGCVTTRGARQTHSSTVTIASSGVLADSAARAEAIALIGSGIAAGPDAAAVPGVSEPGAAGPGEARPGAGPNAAGAATTSGAAA